MDSGLPGFNAPNPRTAAGAAATGETAETGHCRNCGAAWPITYWCCGGPVSARPEVAEWAAGERERRKLAAICREKGHDRPIRGQTICNRCGLDMAFVRTYGAAALD